MSHHTHPPIFPKTISDALQNEFNFPDDLLFAQVATQSESAPHIRTMRLYGVEEQLGLVFLTHLHARKWQDLKIHPKCALCFVHPNYRLQLVAECDTRLITATEHLNLAEKYWKLIKSDVKKIYKDEYPTTIPYEHEYHIDVPFHPQSNFGMMIAVPYFWEYMLIGDDHPNSVRYHFTRNAHHEWNMQRLTVS